MEFFSISEQIKKELKVDFTILCILSSFLEILHKFLRFLLLQIYLKTLESKLEVFLPWNVILLTKQLKNAHFLLSNGI